MAFDHEKLDVDQLALEFLPRANDIERLPWRYGDLAISGDREWLSGV